MVKNWERCIDVSRYDSRLYSNKSLDFRKETALKSESLKLTYAKLCINTAKAMLTNASYYTPGITAFARTYFNTIPFLLSEKDGYLAIEDKNRNVLRDFSKSTRIGEIAQGICYTAAFDMLDAYAVYDYVDFVKNKMHVKDRIIGRTPDYVLCYRDGTYGVLESKGTMAANPTPLLKSGKEQFENGVEFLTSRSVKVKNGYASNVSFATTSKRMNRYTHMYLVDPIFDGQGKIVLSEKENIFYECSKLICLSGHNNVANQFKLYKRYNNNALGNLKQLCDDTKGIIGSFPILIDNNEIITINLGLSESLIHFLNSDEDKAPIFESYIKGNVEYLPDGTFIGIA